MVQGRVIIELNVKVVCTTRCGYQIVTSRHLDQTFLYTWRGRIRHLDIINLSWKEKGISRMRMDKKGGNIMWMSKTENNNNNNNNSNNPKNAISNPSEMIQRQNQTKPSVFREHLIQKSSHDLRFGYVFWHLLSNTSWPYWPFPSRWSLALSAGDLDIGEVMPSAGRTAYQLETLFRL